MTHFIRFSGLKAITVCAALSMTAGLALAADNTISAEQIVNQLRPKPVTRGLSMGTPQIDPAVRAKEVSFVQTVRNRKTRSLSLGEREEIAEIASSKPNIDLEIQFDYNSADIAKTGLAKAAPDARPARIREFSEACRRGCGYCRIFPSSDLEMVGKPNPRPAGRPGSHGKTLFTKNLHG